MLRIRPYKISDANFIINWVEDKRAFSKWCANSIEYPLTKKSLINIKIKFDKMDDSWLFTTINTEGVPVGFFMMKDANYIKNSVHIGFIIVDPNERGKGYGKDMIKLAIKYAFEMLNVSRVTLRVFDNNEIARKCYLDLGFIDEFYKENSFGYEDEKWGCYTMVIEKTYCI